MHPHNARQPYWPDTQDLRSAQNGKNDGQRQRAFAIAGLFVALGVVVGLLATQWWSDSFHRSSSR